MAQPTTVKIVGPAGTGIKSIGRLLSRILAKHRFFLHDYSEYPSLVRGGHNTYQVSFSPQENFAVFRTVDFLFSLQPGHWQEHQKEISPQGLIFSEETPPAGKLKKNFLFFPLSELARDLPPVVANTVSLGAIGFLLNLKKEICQNTLATTFPQAKKENLRAFQKGWEFAQQHWSEKRLPPFSQGKGEKEIVDGNEAFGWGFLKGKGDFYAAYPMTPSTGTLHFLAEKQKEAKIIVRHPEDEIAVANMAAGAAFAGARAAVGTSGGGLALMNETISFCGIAEIGVVFYLVQRVGPATGMPTWTAQGDLLFAVFSGHGEFPKVVIAPGDQKESFQFSWQALNLAAELQTPIIVVSDKFLAESSANFSLEKQQKEVKIKKGKIVINPREDFRRYSWQNKDGCSPRTLPGTKNGEFLANSYEHDQSGFSIENAFVAAKMAQKRMKKLKKALQITPKPQLFGRPKNLIVSWGSTKGSILAAIKNSSKWGFLQIKTLWPLHPEIGKILSQAQKIVLVENNQLGQLETLLKTHFSFSVKKRLLKFTGRPFFPEEIKNELEKI